ncbi:MAG: response regulator [Gammaproteobacteria bacterium]|nr:response regulator [Gammaproteobacteria bacterium]
MANDANKILYIEDNPANMRLMVKIVGRIPGYTLISASNAETGLELAAKELPQIVILDINLPGMDGFEALISLKSSAKTKHIPVLALSANAMPGDVEKGLKAGFVAYLTKPIDINEIENTIKRVVENAA